MYAAHCRHSSKRLQLECFSGEHQHITEDGCAMISMHHEPCTLVAEYPLSPLCQAKMRRTDDQHGDTAEGLVTGSSQKRLCAE